MEKDNRKIINLRASTYKRLPLLGRKGETFDAIVQKLLDKVGAESV